MLTDKENVLELASLLLAHGIYDIVLCPGSRNIPLVHTFSSLKEMKCYAVTDERSAGFFALGLALQSGRPAAVCCTSGTALLNLHPAMAEAKYQEIPLLVLSADRPAAWINQMDGQTLNQVGVFDQLGIHSVTLPEPCTEEDRWHNNRLIQEALSELELNHPAHINLPLTEPLFNFTTKNLPHTRKITINRFHENPDELMEKLETLKKYKRILLVCGQSRPVEEAYHLPPHIVCLSEHLGNQVIKNAIGNFDQILIANSGDPEKLAGLTPDLLITIGGHIVSKRFKQFIRKYPPKEHWQINPEGKIIDLFCCLRQVWQIQSNIFLSSLQKWTTAGEMEYAQHWHQLSRKIPTPPLDFSEIGAIGQVLHSLPPQTILHLANSSAVRYAQLFPCNADQIVQCNRGTSGIEGSLSTAVGYAAASSQLNLVIIGDLSFFYDANALWNHHVRSNLRILLINNGGGEIFKNLRGRSPMPASESFILGTHHANAKAWTEGMGWEYHAARNEAELRKAISLLVNPEVHRRPLLLEVFTDADQDAAILKEYHNQLKNL